MTPTNTKQSQGMGRKIIITSSVFIFLLLAVESAAIYVYVREVLGTGIETVVEKGWIVSAAAAREGLLLPVRESGYFIFGVAVVFMAIVLFFLICLNAWVVRPFRLLMEKKVANRQNALKMVKKRLAKQTNELRRIENELTEWRERFGNLFENSAEAILLADQDGILTKANNSAGDTFRFDPVDMPGKSIFGFCGEKEDFDRLFSMAEQEGPIKRHEITMRKTDGTVFPTETSLTILKDKEGKITGSMVAVRDTSDMISAMVELGSALGKLKSEIKEREKVDVALAEAKDYLENVFDNSADVIIVVDKYSRIVNWNKMATEFFGYSFEELKGKSTFELYSDKEELEELLSVLLKRGSVKRYEITMKKKDGTVSPIEASISMLRDGNKKLIGSVAVIRDLSEIKKAMTEVASANEKLKAEIAERMRVEEELLKARDHLENVIENSADAIGIVDRDGKFVKWNRAAVKTFGYTFEEVKKVPLEALYADPAEHEHMRGILHKHGTVSRYEIGMMSKDGRELPIEISIARLNDPRGDTIGSVCIGRDLSDLKKAFLETEKARWAAEEANRKILESMNYARTIQRSLLPNMADVKQFLSDSFFMWSPRELVGGDFYHAEAFEEGFFVAVFDCTGHGVPGAFMTMIASSGLRRIIGTEGCRDPAEVLSRLNHIVKTTLHQDTGHVLSDDGLDAAICFVRRDASDRIVINYAGAQIPLYCAKNGKVKVIRGDKRSIGYKRSKLDYRFANHTVEADGETTYYMATDGFIQQLGGPRERSLGSAGFIDLLETFSQKPLEEQPEMLIRAYDEYRGDYERLDDVTIIGFGLGDFSRKRQTDD